MSAPVADGPVVLVTGGAGYVGSHVAKALALAGMRPVTVDDLRAGNRWAVRWGPLEVCDIGDRAGLDAIFARWRPEAVIHLAADALVGQSMRDPGRYWKNNVAGTLTLLEAGLASGCRKLVFSSSCAVYGTPEISSHDHSIDENTPTRPINPYGRSKLVAEQMLADHAMAHDLRHVNLRYFNAAGADPDGEIGECRELETHLIPLAIDAILGHGPPLGILGTDHPTADGTAIRDYVHVADLARAHLRALTHLLDGGEPMTVNLGTGRGHSVLEVVHCLERISGHSVPRHDRPRRPGDPPILVADTTRARDALGLELALGLDDILRSAWNWSTTNRPRNQAA